MARDPSVRRFSLALLDRPMDACGSRLRPWSRCSIPVICASITFRRPSWWNNSSLTTKTYSPSPGADLPPRTRSLEIDYTAMSFTAPQKVRFRYRLDGHDSDWQEAQTRRQAFYNDLP